MGFISNFFSLPKLEQTFKSLFANQHNLLYEESASLRLSRIQKQFLILIFATLIFALYLNWYITTVILIGFITVLYFADLIFNLFLIYKSYSKNPEIKIEESKLIKLRKDWPAYTILCPLYKEGNVLPQFISAISKLEYPKNKLQVILLLEADDKETITQAHAMSMPSNFEILIIPDSFPKTKPKACNLGLEKATGEYIVIYDAEDIPESNQLKKAFLAFEKSSENTVCIQAKLNFYNPRQNLLTRAFTAEYSVWFDLVLTGLQEIKAPIPLGGTSNHFKTKILKDIGGWDPFNVTEDCDLGIRLVKKQYLTAVLDSTTHEEANSNLWNWLKQRTRWVKGYIQTYFVHMRHPGEFAGNWKHPQVITFQLIVGGKVLSMLINPIMWILTISYFVLRSQIGEAVEILFPGPILYMSFFSLVIGNFLYIYYYMIGIAKRQHYDLVKYVIFVPFYWLGMSIAAYRAIFEFGFKPYYWFKTTHGLYQEDKNSLNQVKSILRQSLAA